MKMLNPRYALATLAISGIAAGASLFGTGIASADMIDDLSPLLGSTCSFKQIDAAMHVSAPDMAARLDSSPVQKGVLEMAYNVPMETRTKAFQEFSAQKQKNGMETALAASPELGQRMGDVAKTCANFNV
ncbi:hemophore-related protein [Nocardia sp. NBC_01499]|uniref:hemophore-related protein n=1 Tax=Nocardia sp. NBC_01499 TaxID=2903597 RepID=UPI00386E50F3